MHDNSFSKDPKSKKILVYLAAVLILVFIWSNSLDNPNESYSKSQKVLEFGTKVLSKILGSEHWFTVFFTGHVRKIAHFVEYMFLGTVVTIGMAVSGKKRIQHIYNSLSFAVITAVVDEFIQIYTYRGSSVRDVIIDFSGYFIGTLLIAFIITIIILVKLMKSRNHEY